MPAKDALYWQERTALEHPCHYLDPITDAYAFMVRTAAMRRLWPAQAQMVLDVGCGNGEVAAWMKRVFGVNVTGADLFRYWDIDARVDHFVQVDAEHLTEAFDIRQFDLATAITVLPFLENWRQAVAQMCCVASRVLVVENTTTPTPPWQQGQRQKWHIEYPMLDEAFAQQRFHLAQRCTVNVLDRAWLLRSPGWLKWPVMWATLAADLGLARIVPPERARYTASLYTTEV